MTSRVELDLPPAGDSLPLSDLERFVEHAVAADQDPDITIALRVEFDSTITGRADLDDLLRLLTEIERNDGDTPAQHRAIRELRQRLTGYTE
ncbi:MAG: hypothetical protein ACT4NY_03605 [Pseudonocardiales bacterium]